MPNRANMTDSEYDIEVEISFDADSWTIDRLIDSGRANAYHQKAAYKEREYFRSGGEEDWEETDSSYYISCKDEATLHRWAVNYALHGLTNYSNLVQNVYFDHESCPVCTGLEYEDRDEDCEACMELYCERIDEEDKYKDQVKIAVLKVIAEKWPVLTDECERQNPSNYE